jgi:hypothetical protein
LLSASLPGLRSPLLCHRSVHQVTRAVTAGTSTSDPSGTSQSRSSGWSASPQSGSSVGTSCRDDSDDGNRRPHRQQHESEPPPSFGTNRRCGALLVAPRCGSPLVALAPLEPLLSLVRAKRFLNRLLAKLWPVSNQPGMGRRNAVALPKPLPESATIGRMATFTCASCGASLGEWAREGTRCPECVAAEAEARAAACAHRNCAVCEKRFRPRQPTATFCSSKCRQRAYRQRRRRVAHSA